MAPATKQEPAVIARRDPHDALAMKAVAFGTCGCDVRGAGVLTNPVKIHYCPAHGSGAALLVALEAVEPALENATTGCGCTAKQRDSGHLTGCHVPQTERSLEQVRAALAATRGGRS